MTNVIFHLTTDDPDFQRLVSQVTARLVRDGEPHPASDVQHALEHFLVEMFENILKQGMEWLFLKEHHISDRFFDRLYE